MSLYQGGMEGEKSESPDLLCESASGAPQAEVIRRPGTVQKTCRATLAYAAGRVKRALAGACSVRVRPSGLLAGDGPRFRGSTVHQATCRG